MGVQRIEAVYNGVRYARYPDSAHKAARVYFKPMSKKDKARGVQSLHQEIYKHVYGPIPSNHHVHHKDGDPLNNAPGNLAAVLEGDHIRWHNVHRPHRDRICTVCGIPFRDLGFREPRYCSELCRTRGKDAERKKESRTCIVCGATFETPPHRTARCCSQSCAAIQRLRDHPPVRTLTCLQCGKEWSCVSTNPHARFCTPRCRAMWNWRHR